MSPLHPWNQSEWTKKNTPDTSRRLCWEDWSVSEWRKCCGVEEIQTTTNKKRLLKQTRHVLKDLDPTSACFVCRPTDCKKTSFFFSSWDVMLQLLIRAICLHLNVALVRQVDLHFFERGHNCESPTVFWISSNPPSCTKNTSTRASKKSNTAETFFCFFALAKGSLETAL